MDALHREFLHILKTALLGEQLTESALTEQQLEAIAQLAQQHKVLPLVFDAIHGLSGLSGTALFAELRKKSRQQILLQTRKTYDFLQLYQALRAAGVTPLVVKGIVCRRLYPQPDLRPSSDEDLLIPPSQFALCHEILTQYGLRTQATPAQMETDYEIPYRGEESPLFIELHKHLFPPESEAYGDLNRFFENAWETAVEETVDGVAVATLAPTDHLFYLIVHALKHFLHSGFGIRQVCDIVLYANAWGNRVDWDTLMDRCRQIRADYFAAAIFRIGQNYLVFDPEKACYPAVWQQLQISEEDLLQDVLLGGVYGSSSMSRQHSSNITLEAVAASKQNRRAGNALLGSLFPPARKLKSRYPWLKKHPWLLPVAWVNRIFRYGLETRRSADSSAGEALKIGNQRIALLEEYGIIE